MAELLPYIGEKLGEGTVLLIILWWLSWRIKKVESVVEAKLSNGIGSRLTKIEVCVARIEGKLEDK